MGARGRIGRRLCPALLARGDEVVASSRGGATGIPGIEDVRWDPAQGPPPAALLDGADAVVNLAGSPMDRRWTSARRRAMRESRIATTRLLADGLGAPGRPRTLVNASGANYYGPRGEGDVDESAPPGDDFLARVCLAWEAEARRAQRAGVRVVLLRTGVGLVPEAGALPRLARPVRLFVGGPLGGGRQWVPWIHVEDQVGIILHALDRQDLAGPVNVTAPEPVRQRDFAAALGRVLGRPAVVPAPGLAVRLLYGEMATLALDGRRVVPRAALASGYRFAFPELEPALRDLLGRPARRVA